MKGMSGMDVQMIMTAILLPEMQGKEGHGLKDIPKKGGRIAGSGN